MQASRKALGSHHVGHPIAAAPQLRPAPPPRRAFTSSHAHSGHSPRGDARVARCTAQPLQSTESIDSTGTYEEIENEVMATEGLATMADVDALASMDSEAALEAHGYLDSATSSVEEENPYDENDAPMLPANWQGGEPEVEILLREAKISRGRGITVDRLQRLFPFPLDKFQRRAVEKLLDGKSVVVCAPTGAGKTAIAEAAAAACLARGQRVIYTTPLKALSNQKLQEVRQRFGQKRAGLQTGDASLNTEADIVVMTTEILRNIMYRTTEINGLDSGTREKRLGDVGLVVLDEVHYLGHPDRGSVWEEAIINCPPHIQLLSMSATVSNPDDLGGWISQEQSTCETVKTLFRPVPLQWHYCYANKAKGGEVVLDPLFVDGEAGRRARLNPRITTRGLNMQDARIMFQSTNGVNGNNGNGSIYSSEIYSSNGSYNGSYGGGGDGYGAGEIDPWEEAGADPLRWQLEAALKKGGKWGLERQLTTARVPSTSDVVQLLQQKDMLPAIYFILSRKDCDLSATSLDSLPLTTPAESAEIAAELQLLREEQPDAVRQKFVKALEAGVASHHAGCLPGWKSLVEKLFQRGLIKVVFATGTLAAGINMPARTTVITSLSRKSDDGVQPLPHNELLQMAGRAGRRGYDSLGHCVVLQSRFDGADAAFNIIRKGPESLESQFTASYGLVLNLLSSYSLEEARSFLLRSFGNYMGHEGNRRVVEEVARLRADAQRLLAAFEDQASAAAKELTAEVKRERGELERCQEAIAEQRCGQVVAALGAEGGLPRLAVLNIAKEGVKPVFVTGLLIQQIEAPQFSTSNSLRAPPRGPFYRCLLPDNRLLRVSVSCVVGLAEAPYSLEALGAQPLEDLQASFDKADSNRFAWGNLTSGLFTVQVTAGSAVTGQAAMSMQDTGAALKPVEVSKELKVAAVKQKALYRKAVKKLEDLRGKAYEAEVVEKASRRGAGRGARAAQSQRGGMEAMAKARRSLKRAEEMEGWLAEERENLWRKFEDVMDVLEGMRALEANKLLPLGVVARSIQSQNELWMAVALTHPAMLDLSGSELAGVLGCLLAPEMNRKILQLGEGFEVAPRVTQVLDELEGERVVLFDLQLDCGLAKWNELLLVDQRCGGVVQAWADGVAWSEIMQGASMDDGDVARLLMRAIDMLRQIIHAEEVLPWLAEPARKALRAMDRSPVAELVMM